MRALLLGIVLLVAGLVVSWGQDVAAPWINAGEAQMGTSLTFASDGGKYRVITSGSTRPMIDQTGCTVAPARGEEFRVLGGEGDVNPNERLGISRVLGFEAPAGAVELTCGDRVLRSSQQGRYQVVDADGLVSIGVRFVFGLGIALLLAGGLLLFRAYQRGSDDPAPG